MQIDVWSDLVCPWCYIGKRRLEHALAQMPDAPAVERFFRGYFTEQRSLFDADSLVAMAADAGLDAGEVLGVLEGNAYADAVNADAEHARALGVTGVPFFVFDQRLGLSGAQPVEAFVEALTLGLGA